MEKLTWTGKITVNVDGRQDAYSPEAIELEEYVPGSFSLKFMGGPGRCAVTVTMNKRECTELCEKLERILA